MRRIFGYRVTPTTLLYGLAIAAFTLIAVFVIFFSSDSSSAGKRLWWQSWPEVDPSVTYITSPYNAAFKRKTSHASVDLPKGAKPKLISWQAPGTLALSVATSDMFKDCPGMTACKVSASKSVIPEASAIVFDDKKMAKQSPPQLTDDRLLIYYNMRPPGDQVFPSKGEMFDQYWTDVFNLVWSYRLDSDIFEPFSYISKLKALEEDVDIPGLLAKKTEVALFVNPQIGKQSEGGEELIDRNLHKGKSHSGVEAFLRAFGKHIPYDTINMTDLIKAMKPRPDGTKNAFSLSKYYFILAFESADCRDYASDLFFSAYDPRIAAVPVVRGGFSYAQHAPKLSYVNGNDYDAPMKLANHLKKIINNTKLYTNLLTKKMMYRPQEALSNAWCQLCDLVYRADDEPSLRRRIDDIYAWSYEGSNCNERVKGGGGGQTGEGGGEEGDGDGGGEYYKDE